MNKLINNFDLEPAEDVQEPRISPEFHTLCNCIIVVTSSDQ